MDPSTIIGLLLAFGSVIAVVFMEGSKIQSLLLPAPMLLVFGATLGVGFASKRTGDAIHAFKTLPKAFTAKAVKPKATIDELVRIADKARKEGLLSLEADARAAKDPFIRNALQNVADGTDGEELRLLLEEDIQAQNTSDLAAAQYFKIMGGYAPTIGIIGTVVSLTHVLENLSSPGELGPSIASAFVATLWGLVSANLMWLPFGDKLGRLAEANEAGKVMVLEGVLAIQGGMPPRLLEERLTAMVPMSERPKSKKAIEK